MRDFVIKKILEIKKNNRGFEKTYVKWADIEVKGKHISVVDFNEVGDEELTSVFERIIRTSQITTMQDAPVERRLGGVVGQPFAPLVITDESKPKKS